MKVRERIVEALVEQGEFSEDPSPPGDKAGYYALEKGKGGFRVLAGPFLTPQQLNMKGPREGAR